MTRVTLRSLRKEFETPTGVEIAVDSIDLDIKSGEFVTLVGPSGCGKTTTLRCIAGLETPTSGEIIFDDVKILDTPANKRNIAMMFQNIALYPHMKVKDNIAYPLKVRGIPKERRYERATESAELMQVADFLDKYPGAMSGGQQQRTALARTVVQEPQVFLMDEPLSDLDAKLKVEIRKDIQQIHKRIGQTTIYVTHDQEEALTMSDRVVVMNNGSIEQVGTPDSLYSDPANMFVAGFVGNPAMNFIDVEVVSVEGSTVTLSVQGKSIDFVFEVDDDETLDSTVTLGFRPETITLGENDGDMEIEIVLIERIGDRLLVTLEGSEGEIRATVPAEFSYEEAQIVPLTIEKDKAHLFDRVSGRHVAKGTNLSTTMIDET